LARVEPGRLLRLRRLLIDARELVVLGDQLPKVRVDLGADDDGRAVLRLRPEVPEDAREVVVDVRGDNLGVRLDEPLPRDEVVAVLDLAYDGVDFRLDGAALLGDALAVEAGKWLGPLEDRERRLAVAASVPRTILERAAAHGLHVPAIPRAFAARGVPALVHVDLQALALEAEATERVAVVRELEDGPVLVLVLAVQVRQPVLVEWRQAVPGARLAVVEVRVLVDDDLPRQLAAHGHLARVVVRLDAQRSVAEHARIAEGSVEALVRVELVEHALDAVLELLGVVLLLVIAALGDVRQVGLGLRRNLRRRRVDDVA